ncbi:class I SAM-dependent methyltransferase [Endobacterium cereale]|uniref:class I SAM-dependent methyltransferase n=1 Tax=Endobacterium cereale TaxID=2663029 RepID=UPI002B4744BB|nr:class I SAM-dependent methyltransferase [Endobacterium cereale]MEB2846649.1 class I SAM-dependent methyltransferase [Endobacterium cereale]
MMDPDLLQRWRNAPRLNDFSAFFERTAAGQGGAPDLGEPRLDLGLLDFDLESAVFADTHKRLWGPFDFHYFASIPYRLEEECRMGPALVRTALETWARHARPASIYTLGTGTGCLARTVALLGAGRIEALCCSPTAANREAFLANRASDHAHFHLGPFFELDADRYATDPDLRRFAGGFDILFEDTTFQMYDRDRVRQIEFVYPRIRAGGLLIQVQKLAHLDADEYQARERQKDDLFKSRYFSPVLISDKKEEVLGTMTNMQVDKDATVGALKSFFRYSVATWNSGNFYTIISSNSRVAIIDFLSLLLKPAIPPAFSYADLPAVWIDTVTDPIAPALAWRRPNTMDGVAADQRLAS